MKSFYSIAIFAVILVAVIEAAPPSPGDPNKTVNECKLHEKASEDDVMQFMNHKLPSTQSAKCFAACMHEKSGFIKDGKVNVEALGPLGPMKDGKPAGQTSDAIKECTKISHPDRCELSFKVVECLDKVFNGNGSVHDIKKN